MSRLRRDRHALKVARYVRRCDALTGLAYTGVGRWGMASYRALNWLHLRRVRAQDEVRADNQAIKVNTLFYTELDV